MTCHCVGGWNGEMHRSREEAQQRETMAQERISKDKVINDLRLKLAAQTPDPKNYEILEAEVFGENLVIKAKFPNCASCSYEGVKVLVYLNTTTLQALKWKELDPHFRPLGSKSLPNSAPSPDARFPASPAGWMMACELAKKYQPQ